MSNGIDAEGREQSAIPLTGERIIATMKDGNVIRGMYQCGKIYCRNRETFNFSDAVCWFIDQEEEER